ncbi:hypothetical protein [Shewanella sp.]|uniref:hypothetical protein n=1 Tax=Shewanella sp. TaxID=50422 RepID=UPI004053C771
MTNTSVTIEQAIVQEANRVIATLSHQYSPASPEMVEGVLESLQAIAETVSPLLSKTLGLRLVALRHNIPVKMVA